MCLAYPVTGTLFFCCKTTLRPVMNSVQFLIMFKTWMHLLHVWKINLIFAFESLTIKPNNQ